MCPPPPLPPKKQQKTWKPYWEKFWGGILCPDALNSLSNASLMHLFFLILIQF